MTITPALNLGLPVKWATPEDPKAAPVPLVWAYHTPISREVFEANYAVISDTQLAIAGKGAIGQGIAALALRDAHRAAALALGDEEGANAPPPLLAELKRLTFVLAPSGSGYEQLPVDIAKDRGIIDADDWAEAESVLVFFTCAYSVAKRPWKERIAKHYASVLEALITSLPPMEFAASLTMSTPAATSETSAASSVPS